MTLLRNILIGLVGLVLVLAVAGYFLLPKAVTVEETIEIDRPASLIFTSLAGSKTFHATAVGSTDARTATFEGPDFGVGAKTLLSDGSAREVLEAKPYESVKIALGPSEAKADVTITIAKGETAASKVTWSAVSSLGANPVARFLGQFRGPTMKKEAVQTLGALKQSMEALPNVDVAGVTGQVVQAPGGVFIFVAGETTQEPQVAAAAVRSAMKLADAVLTINRIEPVGPGLVVTTKWENGQFGYRAGFPIASKPAEALRAGEDVAFADAPKGDAFTVAYEGPVDGLSAFYEKARAYAQARGMTVTGAAWEAYPYGAPLPGAPLKLDIHFPVSLPTGQPIAPAPTIGDAPAPPATTPVEAAPATPDPSVAAPAPPPAPAPATDGPVDLTAPSAPAPAAAPGAAPTPPQ